MYVDREISAVASPDERLRENLTRLMDEKRISGRQLAKQIGTGPTTVNNIRRGVIQSPRSNLLGALADALDVSIDELQGRVPMPERQSGQVETDAESRTAEPPPPAPAGAAVAVTTPGRLDLRGVVEAGVWREDEAAAAQARTVEFPADARYPKSEQFAFEVRGDAMADANIPDGCVIRCVAWADLGITPIAGLVVVTERTRAGGAEAQMAVMAVAAGPDGVLRLEARSPNPKHEPKPMQPTAEGETFRIVGLVTAAMTTF